MVRELLGTGTILGFQILPEAFKPILFFLLPPGGFLVFALFISLNIWLKSLQSTKAATSAEGGER
jgi:electron transport complex protein RnfE